LYTIEVLFKTDKRRVNMGTKNSPAAHDCYASALPQEEMFVLLARDFCAPALIRSWCGLRIGLGLNGALDPQIIEAFKCAQRMEDQQARIRQELREARSAANKVDIGSEE
jgi:hypothetical protein